MLKKAILPIEELARMSPDEAVVFYNGLMSGTTNTTGVVNGNFERGGGIERSGWSVTADAACKAEIGTIAKEGVQSLLLSNMNAPSKTIAAEAAINGIADGKVYKLSVWYYIDPQTVLTGSSRISFAFYQNGTAVKNSPVSVGAAAKGVWYEHVLYFLAPSGTTGPAVRIVSNSASTSAMKVYIDNVTVSLENNLLLHFTDGNAGFESYSGTSIAGFSLISGTVYGTHVTYDSTNPAEGNYCLKINQPDAGTPVNRGIVKTVNTTVLMLGGKELRIAFKVKALSTATQINVKPERVTDPHVRVH